MSKHFKVPYFVAACGMAMAMIFMTLEARGNTPALTLPHEAACYALARAANFEGDAMYHRTNLRTYRRHQSSEVDYYIGFRLGYLLATTERLGVPLQEVAASEYNTECQEEA